MAQNVNYNRPKISTVNSTPISFSVEAAEVGGTEAALAAGASAGVQGTLIADADESGGADLQDWATFTVEPVIDADTGIASVKVTVTPILGDGSSGTAKTLYVPHEQTMDAWQTAAGRARQA